MQASGHSAPAGEARVSGPRRLAGLLALTAAIVVVTVSCTVPGTPTTPAAPTTGTVDLVPALLSYAENDVVDGGTISTALTLQNNGSQSYSGPITIDYYVATTSTFDPGSDTAAGTTTVSGIGANTSTTVNYTVTMPDIGVVSNSYDVVYVYADVDPLGATGDAVTSNNVSAPSNAAVVLVYKGSPASYSLTFDTFFPPTAATGQTSGTGATNIMLALYQDNGSGGTYVMDDTVSNDDYFGHFTVANLAPGTTYYIVALTAASGPYALSVHSSNIDLKNFASLSAPPITSNQHNDVSMYTTIQNKTTLTSIPATPYALKVGNAVNWYGSTTGDCQWFTFTLP